MLRPRLARCQAIPHRNGGSLGSDETVRGPFLTGQALGCAAVDGECACTCRAIDWSLVWPVLLIGVNAIVLVTTMRRRTDA